VDVDSRTAGLTIAVIGLVAVIVGLGIAFGLLSWFGRLPGDIRIETGSARIYIPLVSTLLVSLALTLILGVARRLF
jgi:hypothetical protein